MYNKPYAVFSFREAIPVWNVETRNDMNRTLKFCASVPKGAFVLNISAHSSYRFYINGVLSGAGPARAAHGFFRVDSRSFQAESENNTIEILVAGYNINSYCSTDEPPFLCAEIIRGDKVIFATGTDRDFKAVDYRSRVQRSQRYSFQRQFTEIYDSDTESVPIAVGPVGAGTFITRQSPFSSLEEVSAVSVVSRGKIIKKENPPKFNDRSYSSIGEKLKGFIPSDLSEMPVSEVLAMKVVSSDESADNSGMVSVLYDMGMNTTGYIRIGIIPGNDGPVYAVHGEKLGKNNFPDPADNGCVNVIKWKLKGAVEYDLTTYEPYCYRFILIIVPAGSEIVRVSQFREARPTETLVNRIAIGDAEIAKIYDAACESFLQNATDIFMDCPGRERAGWLCDSFFTGRTERALTGKTETEHDFLQNFILPEGFGFIPEGMLPMCYPADHNDGVYIHNWALWYVIEFAEYIAFSGDCLLKNAAKERILKLRDFTASYENGDGLIEKQGSWKFVEWSEANDFVLDVNYPTNMLYALFLDSVAALYGDKESAFKAEKVRKTVREQSFDGKFFRDHAVRNDDGRLEICDDITETCQYYALFTNTASKEEFPQFFEMMVGEFGPVRNTLNNYPSVYRSNAFIGNYLRLEILRRENYYDKLISEIRDFFLPMAEKTGTLWEHMTDNASRNHGFTSYVAVIINEIYGRK